MLPSCVFHLILVDEGSPSVAQRPLLQPCVVSGRHGVRTRRAGRRAAPMTALTLRAKAEMLTPRQPRAPSQNVLPRAL